MWTRIYIYIYTHTHIYIQYIYICIGIHLCSYIHFHPCILWCLMASSLWSHKKKERLLVSWSGGIIVPVSPALLATPELLPLVLPLILTLLYLYWCLVCERVQNTRSHDAARCQEHWRRRCGALAVAQELAFRPCGMASVVVVRYCIFTHQLIRIPWFILLDRCLLCDVSRNLWSRDFARLPGLRRCIGSPFMASRRMYAGYLTNVGAGDRGSGCIG